MQILMRKKIFKELVTILKVYLAYVIILNVYSVLFVHKISLSVVTE